jgi:hypothetical protein
MRILYFHFIVWVKRVCCCQLVFHLIFVRNYQRISIIMAVNRGAVWSRRERLLLLQIWRDEDVEGQLQGLHRNHAVYSNVADLL